MTEGMIQEQVARYVAIKYRDAIFHSDFGSGAHLTKLQAIKQNGRTQGAGASPISKSASQSASGMECSSK